MNTKPILYSFRRCPYAIRTRMALRAAAINYEHREVVLKDKPPELLQASAKGTVPVLVFENRVLDESLDIMRWALAQQDPEQWLGKTQALQKEQIDWVAEFEAAFKPKLDAYKYADAKTAEGVSALTAARDSCEQLLNTLDKRLQLTGALFGERPGFADVAAFPFIRQYSNVDANRFRASNLGALHQWLDHWLESAAFLEVMQKFPRWHAHSGNSLSENQ